MFHMKKILKKKKKDARLDCYNLWSEALFFSFRFIEM